MGTRVVDVGSGASRGSTLGVSRLPIRHIDPVLIVTTILLSVYGLFMVYSASHQSLTAQGADPGLLVKKQLTYLLVGVIAMILIASFDYRLAKVYAIVAFAVMIVALFVVMLPFIGTKVAGAQRWITILGFQFQPSEPAKLAFIAMLAAYLSELKAGIGMREVMRAATIAIVPMGFAFIQPDVGTSMVFAATLAGVLLVAGTRGRYMVALAMVAILAVAGAFQVGLVKDYQLERLRGFFDGADDPLRAGYNRAQSEIAIGNGGVTGEGYLQGSQTNLDFVPAQQTDFIFTAIGEELGFVGAMFLFLLLGILLWRGFRTALLAKDPFGTYVAAGIISMWAFMSFVNIGMTMGIMPVTGIPLPFVSYGGTALITNFFAAGLLLNIHMRRFK